MNSPGLDDVGQFLGNLPAITPAPDFIHQQDFLARATLGHVIAPGAEPAEGFRQPAGEHAVRIEAHPMGCQGFLDLDGGAGRPEPEPGGRLPAIIEDEPAGGRDVQEVAQGKRGLAGAGAADNERLAGGKVNLHGLGNLARPPSVDSCRQSCARASSPAGHGWRQCWQWPSPAPPRPGSRC